MTSVHLWRITVEGVATFSITNTGGTILVHYNNQYSTCKPTRAQTRWNKLLGFVKQTLSNKNIPKKRQWTNATNIKWRLSGVEERINAIYKLCRNITTVKSVGEKSQEKLKTIDTKQLKQTNLIVDDVNNRLRRNNLIFKKISEKLRENWDYA